MTRGISRRGVLRGIGQSAAIGSLAAGLPRVMVAAEAAPAAATAAPAPAPDTFCLTTLYLSGEGAKFDGDAFRDRHVQTLKSAYGSALERVELRVAVTPPASPAVEGAPAPPAPPPPPFLAASSMWFKDLKGFIDGIKAHGQQIGTEAATVTNCKTIVQLDQVVAGFGEARNEVVVGSSCFSYYFQVHEVKDKGAATWDAKGYAEQYLPKLYAAFGTEALQRIEAVKGAAPVGGGQLQLLGSVHFYIADEKKFQEAAATDAFKALAPEEAKYMNAPPYQTLMLVHAAG
jgi:hypothetical protein